MRGIQARRWALLMALVAVAAQAQEATAPAAPAPTPPAAAGKTITGRVIDSLTKEGVPLATLTVKTTSVRIETEVDGSFTLKGMPDRELTLRFFSPGYETIEAVVAKDQTQVAVTMKTSYLEEVVVVGRATEVARKNLANAVSVVSAEDLVVAPAQTVDGALAGKVAGANVQSNSGAPGGGMQIRLRGVSTINANAAPLYVVDGVIVSDTAIASGIYQVTASVTGSNAAHTQDNQVNRIADLNPNDIDNIEVLKGASAAAIYGSKAANGVVLITTKRGRSGPARVDFTQRIGLSSLSNTLGSRTFGDADEAFAAFGPLGRDNWQPIVYDHERELAGRLAPATETSLGVTGSAGDTRYFSSILVRHDDGVVLGTGYDKQSLRLNLGQRFFDRVEINVNTNLVHTLAQRGLTNNDNRGISYYMVFPSTPSFYDLRKQPDGTYPTNPFVGSLANPLQTAALMTNNEDVWRLIGGADAVIDVLKTETQTLKLLGNVGVDRFQQKNELFFPPELFFEPIDDGLPGTSLFATSESFNLNAGVNLIHVYRPTSSAFSATTSAGFSHEERTLSSVYIASRNLNAGQTNVDAGSQIGVIETRQKVIDRGYYLQEELLLLDERLTLSGAVRGEHSSVNGNPYQLYFFPKVAAAYRIPKLPSVLDELKVRAAYGETGNQPLYGQKFTTLVATNNIEGNPGIVVNGVAGDPNIRPERQREFEVGVDVVGFSGRGLLELSLYQRTITDLLLQRNVAPSTGFTSEFFNGGALQNRGIELMLQGTLVQHPSFQWLSRALFTLNRSEITDLPVPAFNTGGFGTSLGTFRIEKGSSATQIVGNHGLRPDGTCCVVEKLGDTEPDFRISFVNNFTFHGFTLSTLIDWQQGSDVINLTRFLYDLSANTRDFVGPGQQRLVDWATDAGVYIEDVSYVKVREISLSYDVPAEWVKGRLGPITSARLSLSGRNLFTFSGYSGLDPEVSNFGNQAIARNIDVAPYPPSRSFWFSLDLGI